VVLDNYGTHKTPKVIRWFARHPRYHLHFTTSGSWINQMERWSAELTEKRIRRVVSERGEPGEGHPGAFGPLQRKSEAVCVDGGRGPDPGKN
jgi:hypothetical protein